MTTLRQRAALPASDKSRSASADAIDHTGSGMSECNICLEELSDPVLTLCGHLYCWSCIFRWLATDHSVCPVCQAGVSEKSLIPVYGRGRSVAASTGKRCSAKDVPCRPAAQRPSPRTHSQSHVSTHTFGAMPSIFGLLFEPARVGPAWRTEQRVLSWVLWVLFGLVLLCLAIF